MSQQLSPWLEGAYGWNFGESNWNTGIDQNQLKFSFMFDRNIDGVVGSLPSAVNGQAYFLTTDKRLYFAVGATWYSTPVPKWFQFVVRSTGNVYQFNGTNAIQIDSLTQLDTRLDAVELTVASLGTAAFEDIEFFATQAQLDIVESDAQAYTDALRQELANNANPSEGATLVGFGGRTVFGALSDRVNVKDYGALGDGAADDSAAISAAIAAAVVMGSPGCIYFPAGTYRTSAVINIPVGFGTLCDPGVVFQRHGGAAKDFPCIQVNGIRHHILGTIDNYADGILVRNSTNTIGFQTISNCTRGVVISAITANSLDNKVSGTQIGLGTEGVVFEQNGVRTQQGNEIRVNFVSNTKHTLVFDDLGTHVSQSNWDSNLVELMASDPFFISGATLALNKTSYPVANLIYSIQCWAGGWNVGDGTITVISGQFQQGVFDFNFAAPVSAGDMVLSGASRTASDSCQFRLSRVRNLGDGSAISAVTINTTFNGGVDLTSKRFRISCVVPALTTGQSQRLSFRHILAQTNFGGRFRIVGVETNAVPLIFNIRNSGGESHGWASIWFYNPSAATFGGATYNFIIEAGD